MWIIFVPHVTDIIVFGFSQEAFIGVEGLDHIVEVDFQKGAMQVDHNLAFHINDTAGTASESIYIHT